MKNKIVTFESKIISNGYGGIDLQCYLTDEFLSHGDIYKFVGKKVKVTIEVLED